jgi:hypothetical protein
MPLCDPYQDGWKVFADINLALFYKVHHKVFKYGFQAGRIDGNKRLSGFQ